MSEFFGNAGSAFLKGLGIYNNNPMPDPGRDLEGEARALREECERTGLPPYCRIQSTGAVFSTMHTAVAARLPMDQPATSEGIAAVAKAIEAYKAKVKLEEAYTRQRKQKLDAALQAIEVQPSDDGLRQAMLAEQKKIWSAIAEELPTDAQLVNGEKALATLQVLERRPAALEALGLQDPDAAAAAGKVLARLDETANQSNRAGDAATADRTWLSNAIDFGPLSGGGGGKMSPQSAKALLALCASKPELGLPIARAAATAKYPDLIASHAEAVIAAVEKMPLDKGGKNPLANPGKYACDLLQMGGDIGPRFFAGLNDYLVSGRQLEADPFDARGTRDVGADQMRSIVVAQKLLKSDDGRLLLDLESDDAKAALGDLLFHPDALKVPMQQLNEHVLDTYESLRQQGGAASEVLAGIEAPTDDAGSALVNRAYPKKEKRPLDAMKTGIAVLAATLKPLTQGPVGSCFATGPARRMQKDQPIEAMKAYAQIATTGQYSPETGTPVAAVTKGPDHSDPLQNAWQFSLATSAAVTGESTERQAFTEAISDANRQLTGEQGIFASFGKSQKLAALNKAVTDASGFVYDPDVEITDSSDGTSSQGRFILTLNGNEVRTRDDFLQEMLKLAIAELGAKTDEEKQALQEKIDSPAFIDAVSKNGYKPWELQSGGWGMPVTNTLRGGAATKTSFLSAKSIYGEGTRMKSMLSDLVDKFGKTDALVPMENTGHSFNALPNHPSLRELQGDSPEATAKNIDAKLTAPGKAMATTRLPAAQAAALFDEALAGISSGTEMEYAGREEVLREAATAFRPGTEMTPKELSECIDKAVANHCRQQARTNADDWEAKRRKSDPQAVITPEDRAKKEAEIETNLGRVASGSIKGAMVSAMGGPQITFADTNWGGAAYQIFFVIAPDPTTGEPMLYQRCDPPGQISVADADFARGEWYCFQ